MGNQENLSGKELVEKLQTIGSLYRTSQKIQREMDTFQPEDNYERKVKVPKFPGNFTKEEEAVWIEKLDHGDDQAIEIAEAIHRKFNAPKEPEEPRKEAFEKPHNFELENKESRLGCLSKVAIGVAVFFVLGALVNEAEFLTTLLICAAVAAAAFLLLNYMKKGVTENLQQQEKEALQEHNRKFDEQMAQYNENMKAYEKKKAEYEVELERFLKDYAEWKKAYLKSCREEEKIEGLLEEDRQAAVNKIYEEKMLPAEAALNEANDLVTEEYLPVLDVIIDLLKSKRADSLKEAINLYEEIVYRERQLELEREKEEQRRYEEQMRRENEERHHQEQMEFQREQERQRQYEEDRRRRDDERCREEEAKAQKAEALRLESQERERKRREEYKAHMDKVEKEREQRRMGQRQCQACAHAGRCSMTIHNSTGSCTGFTPRR